MNIKKFVNRETVLYLVFGVMTTVVNYFFFWLCYSVLFGNTGSTAANAIAFVFAVVFAFVVNKLFVFESKSWSAQVLKKEIPSFVGARVASFLFEEAGLFVSESILELQNYTLLTVGTHSIDGILAAKVVLSVIVVIINYIFCKFFIFKNKK